MFLLLRPSHWVGFALSALLSEACSWVVEPEVVQCTTSADCTNREASFAGTSCLDGFCRSNGAAGGDAAGGQAGAATALPEAWQCLSSSPSTEVSAEVSVTVSFTALDGVAPAGLRVNVCRLMDVACLAPIDTLATDAQGKVTFRTATSPATAELPAGFSGFLEVIDEKALAGGSGGSGGSGSGDGGSGDGGSGGSSKAPDSAFMSSLLFFQAPIQLDAVDPPYLQAITLFRRVEFTALVLQGDVSYNQDRGHAFVYAQDCALQRATNVHLSISHAEADTVEFYLVGGLPSDVARVTDLTGFGGFVQAPVEYLTVTGTLWDAATNAALAPIGSVRMQTRPDWITYARLAPAAARSR
jgi:hypothetical protein